MVKITEDYVSFEVAKLLKERGFDESCYQKYDNEGYLSFNHVGYINSDKLCDDFYALAPTLQMAMKWLREIYNIDICIIPSEVGAGVMDYTYVLYKIYTEDFYFEDLGIQGRANNISKISYEGAAEAAIKYCLENLI